jgi:hypothetical protein
VRRRHLGLGGAALVALAAAVAAGAAWAAAPRPAAAPPTTNQCTKIKGCVTVTGPWVAVGPDGEADFLLECPKRAGVIAGVDALSDSKAVVVSWDAKLGTPIRAGTSTGSWLFFRAYATDAQRHVFQPYIGCIPPPKVGARSTLAVVKPTKTIDRWKVNVHVRPGATKVVATVCGKKGEHLVGGWQSTAFDTLSATSAPDPELASKIHVALTVGDARVTASIRVERGVPVTAYPEVQVGAVCTT